MTVSIIYCSECNYAPVALDVARELLNRLAIHIDELVLVPAAGGVFEIKKDGQVVFDKEQAGRLPQPEEVVKLVES